MSWCGLGAGHLSADYSQTSRAGDGFFHQSFHLSAASLNQTKSAREPYHPQSGAIDRVGLVRFIIMFLLVMYALIEGNRLGWWSAPLSPDV